MSPSLEKHDVRQIFGQIQVSGPPSAESEDCPGMTLEEQAEGVSFAGTAAAFPTDPHIS
jgi:hypothetical protein